MLQLAPTESSAGAHKWISADEQVFCLRVVIWLSVVCGCSAALCVCAHAVECGVNGVFFSVGILAFSFKLLSLLSNARSLVHDCFSLPHKQRGAERIRALSRTCRAATDGS